MGLIGWIKSKLEQRSMLRDPALWREFYGLDSRNVAGVSVNSRSMLGHSPLWRGINLLSSSVAKLPLVTYRREGEDRERDVAHPAYRLLRRRVNQGMRASVWLKLMTYHAILWGNGYSAIVRDGFAAPTALIPLEPWGTWPQHSPEDGSLWYVTTILGQPRRIPADDVFHVRGLSSDGLVGYSVIELLAPSTGTSLAADEYAARWFAGGCQLANVLKIPAHLKQDAIDNMLKDWSKISEGLGRTGKTGVLYDGADLMQLGTDAEKSQLLQAREFGLITCANVLNIPPHKLGHPARTSYASLEQENAAFLSESLEPWLLEFEEEAYFKLLALSEQEMETHFVEFNRAALLKPDMAARATIYASARQWGWLSVNDIRRKENLPGIGPDGDVYLQPANMAPAGDPDNGNDDPGSPSGGLGEEDAGSGRMGDPAGDDRRLGDETAGVPLGDSGQWELRRNRRSRSALLRRDSRNGSPH